MFQAVTNILSADVDPGVFTGHIENNETEVAFNTSVKGKVCFVTIENVPSWANYPAMRDALRQQVIPINRCRQGCPAR